MNKYEQLLAQCRKECVKQMPYDQWLIKNEYPYNDSVFRVNRWNAEIDNKAALLALQRKDEAHDREMEGFEIILNELTAMYSVHDEDRIPRELDSADSLKKQYVVWGKVRKLLTKFRNQGGEG